MKLSTIQERIKDIYESWVRPGESPTATEVLRQRINAFPRWHYEFNLRGVRTPIFQKENVNRNRQRKMHFFDPLVKLWGGSLAGRRVLDLGCNAGFWSLCAIEAGAEYVYGIDGRPMHIEQANLVFECHDVDPSRFRFAVENVFADNLAQHGPFDLALCLGLLYHVNRPVELIQRIADVNTDLMIIDTSVLPGNGATFTLRHESVDEPRHAVDYSLVFVPTAEAVIEIARLCGYKGVMLRPAFDNYEGAHDYRDAYRRAFICSRRTDLAPLHPMAERVF